MPRAPRFEMAVPVQFRADGEQEWQTGTMKNISGSGVLFESPVAPPLSSRLELLFELPPSQRQPQAARVRCWGQVVRLASADNAPQAAIAIDHYRLQRPAITIS